MTFEKVDLYKYFGLQRPENGAGYLSCYIPEIGKKCGNRVRPAMLVLPGGGYWYCSEREKECIAFTFLAQSFVSFTLEYSVNPVRYPAQLLEADMAVLYIRENAERFAVDKDHVACIGFSAGGHLAACLATIPDEKEVKAILGDRVNNARPNAAILSYPVISGGEFAHDSSFKAICEENEELRKRLYIENRVDKNTAPAFIWATVNDNAVPSENSLMLAMAYKKAGVPFELHLYESGIHGLSLATEEVNTPNKPVSHWVKTCQKWLQARGFVVKAAENK